MHNLMKTREIYLACEAEGRQFEARPAQHRSAAGESREAHSRPRDPGLFQRIQIDSASPLVAALAAGA